jgi:crotonobetainyl-CoA:carnitine CoA-transferase CaiB-like acyl-CoA transferase
MHMRHGRAEKQGNRPMSDVLDQTRADATPQRRASDAAPARPLPLAGVRVLDVSQVMAGP